MQHEYYMVEFIITHDAFKATHIMALIYLL